MLLLLIFRATKRERCTDDLGVWMRWFAPTCGETEHVVRGPLLRWNLNIWAPLSASQMASELSAPEVTKRLQSADQSQQDTCV